MSGYSVLEKIEVDNVIDHDISIAVTDSSLPMLEIDEQLSILSGRVPAPLFTNITQLIAQHQHDIDGGKKQIRYVIIILLFSLIILLLFCCLLSVRNIWFSAFYLNVMQQHSLTLLSLSLFLSLYLFILILIFSFF